MKLQRQAELFKNLSAIQTNQCCIMGVLKTLIKDIDSNEAEALQETIDSGLNLSELCLNNADDIERELQLPTQRDMKLDFKAQKE